MRSASRKGVEEARAELPAVLAAAERGQTTVITRHGRPVAQIGPLAAPARQRPLQPLAGSGKGLWGRDSRRTVRELRDEWER